VQDTNEALSAAADVTLDNRSTPESLALAAREALARLRAGAGSQNEGTGKKC